MEDDDFGFDYSIEPGKPADGCCDIAVVIQKMTRPIWADQALTIPLPATPSWVFLANPPPDKIEPLRTIRTSPGLVNSIFVSNLTTTATSSLPRRPSRNFAWPTPTRN